MQDLFLWEDMGGFIRITGCTSPGHQLIIPDSIAGLPVKQIGDYAFRGMDILEEAVLPAGITRVGDHVFYNCLRLKELSFWDGITFVGDGAFKNCDHLESMTFYSRNHHPSSLRRMLTDVMQDITVDYYYLEGPAGGGSAAGPGGAGGGSAAGPGGAGGHAGPAQAKARARLMFPAFYFDYIENYPARIFEEVIYGTGQAYRQCFREADLDYAAYDRLFERSVREDHAATVLQTAVGRLLYPRSLTEERAGAYSEWLKGQAGLCLGWFMDQDDPDTFSQVLNLNLFDRAGTDRMLAAAQEREKAVFASLLMEYYGSRFARRGAGRRRYEL